MHKGWGTYQSLTLSSNFTKVIMGLIVDYLRHIFFFDLKNNLIFTGLNRVQNEDTEDLLRGFLHHELEINYRIEFGNVHRFKTRSGDNRRPPIVARFLYHSDLRFVLNKANKLRGKPFGIREQFPP